MGADAGADGLRQTLAELADRVERYRGSRIGEQDTKAALIVPVLRALGWDVEDLDEVKLEYKRRAAANPVDYALLLQREPVLFIEAKALDENLDDHRWAGQIIGYAMEAGAEWVVLTNGDEYRIYNAHAPVPFERKLFRSISVRGDTGEAVDALRLLTKEELRRKSLAALWRAQSINNRVRQAVEALFRPEPSSWLVRKLADPQDGLTQGDVKAALSRARIELDFPAAEADTTPPSQREPPARRPPERPTRRPPERSGRRQSDARQDYNVTVKQLLDAGLMRAGAQLRARYLKRDLTATVEPDGRVRFGGEVYNSLSVAAGDARVAVKGPPEDGRKRWQTNGWTFWEYEDEHGKSLPVDALRKQYLSVLPTEVVNG